MASVVPAGLWLVVILVVTAVVSRLLATVGTRTAESTAERILGLVNGLFLMLVYIAVFAAVARYDPGSVAVRITSLRATGVVVNAVAIAVTGTAADRLTNWSLRPVIERLRPGELSVPKRFTRLSMAGVPATLFVFGLLFAAQRYGFVAFHPLWWSPFAVVGLLLNGAVGRPLRVPEIGLTRARDPTEDERGRIERCFDRFGRTPGRIVVSAAENDIGVTAAGRGPFRTVAVTEPFLERVDDEVLAVALAQADERARRYHDYIQTSYAILLIFSFCLLLAFLGTLLLGFRFVVGIFSALWILGAVEAGVAVALSGICMVAVASVGKDTAYRADEFVVSQFGAETVGEVYREFGDSLWDSEPDEDKKQYLAVEPKRSVRLEKIGVATNDSTVQRPDDDWTGDDQAERDEPAEPSEPDQSDGTNSETDQQSGSDEDETVERDWSWSDAGTE